MKKQKVVFRMKGQDKTPEKQLNEVEIGNLPEKEFRVMIVTGWADENMYTCIHFHLRISLLDSPKLYIIIL